MINPPELCDKLYSDFLIQGPVVISVTPVDDNQVDVRVTIGGKLARTNLIAIKAIVYHLMALNHDASIKQDVLSQDRLHAAMFPLAEIILDQDAEYATRN